MISQKYFKIFLVKVDIKFLFVHSSLYSLKRLKLTKGETDEKDQIGAEKVKLLLLDLLLTIMFS